MAAADTHLQQACEATLITCKGGAEHATQLVGICRDCWGNAAGIHIGVLGLAHSNADEGGIGLYLVESISSCRGPSQASATAGNMQHHFTKMCTWDMSSQLEPECH